MLTVADRPLISIPIHLAISKKRHATALLRRFDAAVERLRVSGEINLIVNAELERARAGRLPAGAAKPAAASAERPQAGR
jgi:hypothetical protein